MIFRRVKCCIESSGSRDKTRPLPWVQDSVEAQTTYCAVRVDMGRGRGYGRRPLGLFSPQIVVGPELRLSASGDLRRQTNV